MKWEEKYEVVNHLNLNHNQSHISNASKLNNQIVLSTLVGPLST